MKKYKIHIPTSQYGFLECKGDRLDELLDLHNSIADKPLARNNGAYIKIKTFTKETILYNDATHIYTDEDGNKLVSGSNFAKDFGKVFPKDMILPKVAKKAGVSDDVIDSMWSDSGEAAAGFGTAIHKMLENYAKYRGVSAYKLPNHKVMQDILTSCPIYEEKRELLPEVMLSNIERKMCGMIDILAKNKDGSYDVLDYKIVYNIQKDIDKYTAQLSYYAHILKFAGHKVNKLYLIVYDGKWEKIEVKIMTLKEMANPKKEITI